MDFFETVAKRASVRSFKERRMTSAEWESLLRAAMAAPSAVNCQPWDFIVIEDRERLEKLASALPFSKMTAGAAGAILICATPMRAYGASTELAVIDASLAGENILLAATALGLGAVWTAVHPDPSREATVRAILAIPAAVIPLALLPIGEPAGPVAAKDKYNADLVHHEAW
jgi:nitroreductase